MTLLVCSPRAVCGCDGNVPAPGTRAGGGGSTGTTRADGGGSTDTGSRLLGGGGSAGTGVLALRAPLPVGVASMGACGVASSSEDEEQSCRLCRLPRLLRPRPRAASVACTHPVARDCTLSRNAASVKASSESESGSESELLESSATRASVGLPVTRATNLCAMLLNEASAYSVVVHAASCAHMTQPSSHRRTHHMPNPSRHED